MAQPSISRPRLMVPGGTRPARAVSLASWPIKLVAEPKAALRPDAGLQLLGGPVMGSASGHGRRHPGNWGATAAQTSSGRYCAMSGLLNPRGSTWRRGLSCLENHPGEDALFIAIGTTGQNPSDDSVVRQHTHAQAKLSQDLRLRQFFVPCVGMTRTPAALSSLPSHSSSTATSWGPSTNSTLPRKSGRSALVRPRVMASAAGSSPAGLL